MKRAYSSQGTTQETILSEDMSGRIAKKSRSYRKYKGYRFTSRRAGVPRNLSSNSVIIPRTVDYDENLTADYSHGFGFSATTLYINGVPVQTYSGASEVYNLFDLVRVVKVEVTLIPGASSLDINTPSLGAPYNLPYVYEAFDPNDSTNPSLNDMRELATLRTHQFSKPIRRTIYPVMNEGNNVINTGQARKDMFCRSDTSDIVWYGWKCYMDMISQVLTYVTVRASFKVFLECKQSK